MERSPESVFEHAWFMARAPQQGCVGLVKWTMYRTDLRTGFGKWGLTRRSEQELRAHADVSHDEVVQSDRGQDWLANGLAEKDGFLVSRFIGPAGGQESIFILNDHRDNRDVPTYESPERTKLRARSYQQPRGTDTTARCNS